MSAISRGLVRPGIFVDGRYYLQFQTYGSTAGALLTVDWRIEQSDGSAPPKFDQVTKAMSVNRAVTQITIGPLGEGVLTLVTAYVSATANPIRGQCYTVCNLREGLGSGLIHKLFNGYLAYNRNLSWPPGLDEDAESGFGYLSTVTGTNPAAGAEVADTVPAGALWKLYGVEVVLVTDGTVANRNTALFIDDAGSTVTRRLLLTDTTNQTASQTRTHGWYPGTDNASTASVSVTDTVTVLAKYPMSLQNGVLLAAGSNIRTVTTGIVAGDDYGAPRYIVEEWLKPQ